MSNTYVLIEGLMRQNQQELVINSMWGVREKRGRGGGGARMTPKVLLPRLRRRCHYWERKDRGALAGLSAATVSSLRKDASSDPAWYRVS